MHYPVGADGPRTRADGPVPLIEATTRCMTLTACVGSIALATRWMPTPLTARIGAVRARVISREEHVPLSACLVMHKLVTFTARPGMIRADRWRGGLIQRCRQIDRTEARALCSEVEWDE